MEHRVEIIPAILPENFGELSARAEMVKSFAATIHLDAGDGAFAAVSWPYNGNDAEIFADLSHEDEGLPHWETLDYEAHLMVAEPENVVEDWIKAGVTRVIAHIEAIKDFDALLAGVGDMTELVLALKLQTSLEALKPFAARIQGIHLMTIAEIGEQGIPFQEDSVERVRAARAMYPDMPLSVDGGINLENAAKLVEAGASRLIVGSALFESENPAATYREFQRIIGGNDSHSS